MISLLIFAFLYCAGLFCTYQIALKLAAGLENKSSLAWYVTTTLSIGIFLWTNEKRKKSSSANSLSYLSSLKSDKWFRRAIFTGFSTMQIAMYAGSAVFFTNTYWQKLTVATIIILFVMELVALTITFAQYELKE